MREDKASTGLFLCLFFVYTMNTFGKIAFPAVTAALVDDAILTKTQAGTISGVYWLLYAAGQFAGGALASKYSPLLLIKIGTIGAVVTNFLLVGVTGYVPIFIIWSLNGLLQFGVWPGILALMTSKIIPEQRTKSFDYISYCYGIGSILSHLCTAFILTSLKWNYVFVCCGVMSVVSLVPIIYAERKLMPYLKSEEIREQKTEESKLPKGFIIKSGLAFFCILFFIKSVLESGVKTWMPTILLESHGLAPSVSSVLSAVLLVANLFGISICRKVYEKAKRNEVTSLFVIYLTIVPFMIGLLFFRNMPVYMATVFFSLITVLLYGSGPILSMHYPSRFQKIGGTAFIGGIMNCFAAIGNVVATYGNGLTADVFGWDVTIGIWNVFVVIFMITIFILIPIWKKFRADNGIK